MTKKEKERVKRWIRQAYFEGFMEACDVMPDIGREDEVSSECYGSSRAKTTTDYLETVSKD